MINRFTASSSIRESSPFTRTYHTAHTHTLASRSASHNALIDINSRSVQKPDLTDDLNSIHTYIRRSPMHTAAYCVIWHQNIGNSIRSSEVCLLLPIDTVSIRGRWPISTLVFDAMFSADCVASKVAINNVFTRGCCSYRWSRNNEGRKPRADQQQRKNITN